MTQLSSPSRILVVDDHPLLREGLLQLIASTPDLEVYGEAGDVAQTILAVDEDPPPDLVILDLMLGHSDGLELIKQIRILRPALPILVISMHEEIIYAERALRAGAAGFVMKKESSEKVIEAARAILRGELYLSGRMKALLEGKGETEMVRRLVPDAHPPLSDRELQIYRLIGAGLATREIAAELHLSIKTIETYRENLKLKLRLDNARELTRSARNWVDGL